MLRLLVAALLVTGVAPAAQAPPTRSIIDNPYVTVWDASSEAMASIGAVRDGDAVVIYLSPASKQGKVDYLARGADVAAAVQAAGATRAIVIALKERPAPPLPNTSGFPDAFPRAGDLKKPIDNARVVVWDYTFERGRATAMHFHPRDVVTVYLKEGANVSTTPDGTKTSNEFSFGTVRFNPRNRTHTEMVVRGESHIISVELK
jgi:hypothetical protein